MTGPMAFISLINGLIEPNVRDCSRALLSLVLKYLLKPAHRVIELESFSLQSSQNGDQMSLSFILSDPQKIRFNKSTFKTVFEL